MRPVDPRVVELLNDALTLELSVVNTYFLHARMLDNWGFPRLGKVFYDLSIDEMRDADALITRVLFFEGHPNIQRLQPLAGRRGRRGDAPPGARGRERSRRPVQRLGPASAHDLGDHGTASVFEEMVRDEEKTRGLVRGPDRGDHANRAAAVPRSADGHFAGSLSAVVGDQRPTVGNGIPTMRAPGARRSSVKPSRS